MYYNFGRVHQTLRVTPAMEAGIADHLWSELQVGLTASQKHRGGGKVRLYGMQPSQVSGECCRRWIYFLLPTGPMTCFWSAN